MLNRFIVASGIMSLAVCFTAEAQIISNVRDDGCQQFIPHVPADDVAFVPGVDVTGRPVAPADLNGGHIITAPEEVVIDIRLDLAQRLGLGEGAASALIGGEGVVGQVTVSGDDIYWNGELLPRDSYSAFLDACGEALTSAGVPLPTQKPPPPTE